MRRDPNVLNGLAGLVRRDDEFFLGLIRRGVRNAKAGKPIRRRRRIGRNEPCPCGSGKKFKRCCIR